MLLKNIILVVNVALPPQYGVRNSITIKRRMVRYPNDKFITQDIRSVIRSKFILGEVFVGLFNFVLCEIRMMRITKPIMYRPVAACEGKIPKDVEYSPTEDNATIYLSVWFFIFFT